MSSKGSNWLPPPSYGQATTIPSAALVENPIPIWLRQQRPVEEVAPPEDGPDILDAVQQPADLDPAVALRLISKGKATGNRLALWIRAVIQSYFLILGSFIHRHAGKVLVAGLILLCVCCLGLRNIHFETRLEKLWIAEGKRLSEDLEYNRKIHGSDTGATPLILLQTPDKSSDTSLLSPQAFSLHLKAALVASEFEVEIFKTTWSLKDICHKVPFPNFDETIPAISGALDTLYPCLIKSPLDCFWEGAKLLDPQNPVVIPGHDERLLWSNFNPQKFIEKQEKLHHDPTGEYTGIEDDQDSYDFPSHGSYDMQPFIDFLKKAEVKSGYVERPCLNPDAIDCPDTAPNKKSLKVPTITEEISRGCTGISQKYMKWDDQLLFGDVQKNRSQQIYSASAMQTIFLMSSPKELYDNLKGHMKTSEDSMDTDWTEEAAAHVLYTWQTKYRMEVAKTLRNDAGNDTVTIFFESNMQNIVAAYSEFSIIRIAIGCSSMMVYVCFALKRWSDPVNSYSGLGIAGTVLSCLSVAAGVSLSAFLRIDFNMLSTQVVPFLALGLNVYYVVQMVRTLSEAVSQNMSTDELVGECLKQNGFSTIISTFSISAAFFAGYALPIPALRSFALQMGILTALSCPVMLVLFPAAISLDQRRRSASRLDLFCCYGRPDPMASVQYSKANRVTISGGPRAGVVRAGCCVGLPSRPGRRAAPVCTGACRTRGLNGPQQARLGPLDQRLMESGMLSYGIAGSTNSIFRADPPTCCNDIQTTCETVNVSAWLLRGYLRCITSSFTKFVVLLVFCVVLGCSGWGLMEIEEGLDVTEFVPKNTPEHRYLDVSSKSFGWYGMQVITKGGLDYATNQQVIHDFHQAFQRVDSVVKDKNDKLPTYWLANLRDWLIDLDSALDREIAAGFSPKNNCPGNHTIASAVLACILRAQSGKDDYSLDQVSRTRLVDRRGVINPKAFYYYLSAWAGNGELSYGLSQGMLHLEPKKWIFELHDRNYRIEKSQPLDSSVMQFDLQGLKTTRLIIAARNQIQLISATFAKQGLLNQLSGHIFSYWEQYDGLTYYLLAALIGLLVSFFVVISLALANLWAAALTVLTTVLLLIEVAGSIGWIGIKLNSITAVILIFSTGFAIKFTFKICMLFVTGIGCKNRRVHFSLSNAVWPVAHGAFAMLLGVSMMAFSGFDFIFRYFFTILLQLILLTVFNSLVFLPVLLSFVGPVADFISSEDPETVPTLTPEPVEPRRYSAIYSKNLQKNGYRVGASNVSLSTISEEDSISCQQIILEPQITVETTASLPGPGSSARGTSSEEKQISDSAITSLTSTFTTKVKIEVHRTGGNSSVRQQFAGDDCSCQE